MGSEAAVSSEARLMHEVLGDGHLVGVMAGMRRARV